jgi:protein-histidine pros-kinase
MRLPGPLTATQENQLQIVERSAKHLLSLINDLLDVAKINSGKMELQLEAVQVQSVVNEVLRTLRPLAEAKGLRLESNLPEQKLVIRAERRALLQILLNLTNNAIKFTERGQVLLEVSQRHEPQRVTMLSVSDTGPGIRAEDQERVFEAFEQVGGATRKQEGTGLGLHLSQKLAELLGGEIRLQSEWGKGSTFTLVLREA